LKVVEQQFLVIKVKRSQINEILLIHLSVQYK